MATGWQPGHELFTRNRTEFEKAFLKQHALRGYPLREKQPQDCIDECMQTFGTSTTSSAEAAPASADRIMYILTSTKDGTQILSDQTTSEILPADRKWHLVSGPAGDTAAAVLSDGSQVFSCAAIFQKSQPVRFFIGLLASGSCVACQRL